MKSFEEYTKSGALHRAVGVATREAGAIAREQKLPAAGATKIPAYIIAALAKPQVRKTPELSR